MNLEGGVSIPWLESITAAMAGRNFDTNALDLALSLHRFGIHSEARVRATRRGTTNTWDVVFARWEAEAFDRYDFNRKLAFPAPNPDFQNPHGLQSPVASSKEWIRVYHRNALRMETAGLAAPFAVRSDPWQVTDPEITRPATVVVPMGL
jgi:hypothetical protein